MGLCRSTLLPARTLESLEVKGDMLFVVNEAGQRGQRGLSLEQLLHLHAVEGGQDGEASSTGRPMPKAT